ncbi:hypothetical protein [Gloeocapsa sp. PCC 73106]|uniref:DUF6887 family protein n=1 Tax=Gloeocapsa sp. PCC 73106 TaxID=102232 RepID=UPI0002ABBC3F|nr:hypothetical protein [Gloeocapsa sp. PCC 73106]ELR98526.1 hypothetical protein GLO73106DRAFT_00023600 [Gloeocapsa sp. PCC 73106]
MTKAQLRAYLVAHPDDREAFYAFVDRFTQDTSAQTFNPVRSPADLAELEQLTSSPTFRYRDSFRTSSIELV